MACATVQKTVSQQHCLYGQQKRPQCDKPTPEPGLPSPACKRKLWQLPGVPSCRHRHALISMDHVMKANKEHRKAVSYVWWASAMQGPLLHAGHTRCKMNNSVIPWKPDRQPPCTPYSWLVSPQNVDAQVQEQQKCIMSIASIIMTKTVPVDTCPFPIIIQGRQGSHRPASTGSRSHTTLSCPTASPFTPSSSLAATDALTVADLIPVVMWVTEEL